MRQGTGTKGRKNMKLGIFACAVGRHKVAQDSVKRAHGRAVAKCGRCAMALEEEFPGQWVPIEIRDAGLGFRSVR